jgi:hypothetical protein
MNEDINQLAEDRERNRKSLFAKRDKYEQQGFADKDFQMTLDDKIIKIWLPSSVFAQQALLSLGDKVVHDRFADIEEENKLTERFYKTICLHLQINGASVNPESLELANLQTYSWIYWTELLYPLSLWSDAKARKAIQLSKA